MFSQARTELKELMQLVRESERFGLLVAQAVFVPSDDALATEDRRTLRIYELSQKYELV